MNDLERFHACMRYEAVDRAPFWYGGAWPETLARWTAEGYDPETFDLQMGADRRNVFSKWFFPHPPFAHQVLEEDAQHILYINHEGILMRERKDHPMSSMPQFVRFPVESRADFRRFWRERMQPDLTQRIGPDWQETLRAARAQPHPLIIISDRWGGFFGPLRNLLGVESLCTLFYDDPVFLEEMMDADAAFIVAMMEQILPVAPIDAFVFWEDMAYKTAPLISPQMVRRYMLPRYRQVIDLLHRYDVPWIGLDSDGMMASLIPVWMDAGINVLYPFEVQAGMDVVAVRATVGRDLRMWGGIDKRALTQGPEAIDAELRRVRPLIEEGGFIPHTDHSAPPDIPFAHHCLYMQKLAEVCSA